MVIMRYSDASNSVAVTDGTRPEVTAVDCRWCGTEINPLEGGGEELYYLRW